MPKAKNIFQRAAVGALSAVLAFTISACGSESQPRVSQEQKEAIALTVNDRQFTVQEYAASFLYNQNLMDNLMGNYGQPSSGEITDKDKRAEYTQSIAELAQKQLSYLALCEEQMKARNLEIAQEDVDEQFKMQVDALGGDAQLNAALKDMGVSRAQYSQFIRMNLMVDALREHTMQENPDLARQEFDKDYLRCKHILIKTVDDQNNQLPDQDALEAKAQDIAKRAKAGEDFDALVQAYNEDPGMQSNPDGYVFTDGEMVPEFYEGTRALTMNGISDPVRTDYGWHIIQRLPLRDADFETKRAAVEQTAFSAQVDAWLAQAKVETHDALSQVNMDNARAYAQE